MTDIRFDHLARRTRRWTAWLCLASASATSLGCAASGAAMVAPAMEPPPGPLSQSPSTASADPVAADASSPAGGETPAAPRLPGAPPATSPARPTSAQGAKEVADGKVDAGAPDLEQLLIFDGRLELMVLEDEFGHRLHEVIDLAAKRGGYIHAQDDRSVTLRVPSAGFRDTMKDLEGLGEVVHRSVQAQDVTEKYFDLGVRLKSLIATRERLERFLERAKTIEEVLRVEQELRRLNTEIDALQGQRRFLAARAAYSTITVSLRPKPKPAVVVEDEPEQVAPPPPPPPRTLVLPIDWLGETSLDRLLDLDKD